MKVPRLLRLREYQTLHGVRLTPGEAAQLASCGARLTITPAGVDAYDVTASEVVGAVGLRGLRLVVEPKVPVERLLGLLLFATSSVSFRTTIETDRRDDLLTIMQRLYARALEDALRHGLVHAYQERSDRVHAVRGRIDVGRLQLRHFGVFPPIDCVYQDYTSDTEVNRRLLAAAILLARHQRGSKASGALLALASRMGEVSEVNYAGRAIRPYAIDRRWGKFRIALALAEVVLLHGSVELKDGATHSLGLLVDMNRLFEDVVVEGLRPFLGGEGKWVRQPGWLRLDVENRVPIVPDAVWFRKGQRPIAFDAKYKATTDAKNTDLYQMTAYCQAIGAPHAVVAYADVKERSITVRRGGPVIELAQLALDCDLDELGLRLERLAERVRGAGA